MFDRERDGKAKIRERREAKQSAKRQAEDERRNRAADEIAGTIADHLNGDALAELIASSEERRVWYQVRERLKTISAQAPTPETAVQLDATA